MNNKRQILFLLLIQFIIGTISAQGLKNTHHDFHSAAWNPNGEYCLPCHTPHNANQIVPDSPLWNHQVTTAVYNVYASSSLDATMGQPSGVSKLCLSCHDGTVAVDSHSGITTGTRFILNSAKTGTALTNDHPISFTYDGALAAVDNELYDPSITMSGLGGTIEQDLLRNGKLECTSCHDPHISRNTSGCASCHFIHGSMTTLSVSIWKSNTGSALCLTCHKK